MITQDLRCVHVQVYAFNKELIYLQGEVVLVSRAIISKFKGNEHLKEKFTDSFVAEIKTDYQM